MDSVPKEAEIVYTLVVDPVDNPACLLPLANPFIFSSFLILQRLSPTLAGSRRRLRTLAVGQGKTEQIGKMTSANSVEACLSKDHLFFFQKLLVLATRKFSGRKDVEACTIDASTVWCLCCLVSVKVECGRLPKTAEGGSS
jgi:hypothetical protein